MQGMSVKTKEQILDQRCSVLQDVKWSTLQGLHLGCHEGVHIPSLAAFLQ